MTTKPPAPGPKRPNTRAQYHANLDAAEARGRMAERKMIQDELARNQQNILRNEMRHALEAIRSIVESQAIITKELGFAMQHLNRAFDKR